MAIHSLCGFWNHQLSLDFHTSIESFILSFQRKCGKELHFAFFKAPILIYMILGKLNSQYSILVLLQCVNIHVCVLNCEVSTGGVTSVYCLRNFCHCKYEISLTGESNTFTSPWNCEFRAELFGLPTFSFRWDQFLADSYESLRPELPYRKALWQPIRDPLRIRCTVHLGCPLRALQSLFSPSASVDRSFPQDSPWCVCIFSGAWPAAHTRRAGRRGKIACGLGLGCGWEGRLAVTELPQLGFWVCAPSSPLSPPIPGLVPCLLVTALTSVMRLPWPDSAVTFESSGTEQGFALTCWTPGLHLACLSCFEARLPSFPWHHTLEPVFSDCSFGFFVGSFFPLNGDVL